MKQILISWSSAYDNLMHFDWDFKDQFSTGNLENILNMSVLSSSFERNHWGTGANISYNLALLWESPILLTAIWDDYEFSDVITEKVNLKYVHKQQFCHSAQSMILSDNTDNRITVFHPGAMKYAWDSKVSYVQEPVWLWIVSANNIPTMLEHAREIKQKDLKLVVDPAQQISQMTKEQLRECIHLWDTLIVNYTEYSELQLRAELNEDDLRKTFETIIVTHWAQWSELFSGDEMIHIPAVKIDEIDDTTGAGDAYRAGLLYGIIEWLELKASCQLGTILASYSVIAPGSQQHHFSLWGVMEDMKHHYWVDIDLYEKRKY
jgi:adenosine kinase